MVREEQEGDEMVGSDGLGRQGVGKRLKKRFAREGVNAVAHGGITTHEGIGVCALFELFSGDGNCEEIEETT